MLEYRDAKYEFASDFGSVTDDISFFAFPKIGFDFMKN